MIITATLVGVLFFAGIYLVLHRSFVKILFGFSLLGHGANLFVLSMSGNPLFKLAPIVENTSLSYVDPLPQALILTAIVIGLGVTAYLISYLYCLFQHHDTTHAEDIYE